MQTDGATENEIGLLVVVQPLQTPSVGARWSHPLRERGKKAVVQETDAKRTERDCSTCGQAKKTQSPEYLAWDGSQKQQKKE